MNDSWTMAWPTPARVVVAGELDMYTGPALLESILEHEPPAGTVIEVDLSQVTFIDSGGLKSLLEAHRHGIQLRLAALSPTVAGILRMTGVGSLFGNDLPAADVGPEPDRN